MTTILVVDDEPDLEALILQRFRRQIRDGGVAFLFARDGVEALDLVACHPGIDLALADLNMPRMDGRETLAAIKTDEQFKAIPVVILTTSGAAPDIVASYQHRANAYVTKPFGLEDFESTVRQIDRFYREVASLPDVRP